MNYRNTEMKLDQLVSYLNEEKINLSPVFQRGHVWNVATRRKLMANIVRRRPIPAIFLYKEAEGQRYSYNILDGKQRIESIILFIGDKNVGGLALKAWAKYFFSPNVKKQMGFWIEQDSRKTTFGKLDDETIRDLREYSIPTVEITLNEDSHLDEIISLFVDINQQGAKVQRFDIAKAMGANDALLSSVFKLIAIEQRRGQDKHYKAKSNSLTRVLRKLTVVSSVVDKNPQVDRMWERLLEITLFLQTRTHRKPVDILKSFIRSARKSEAKFQPMKAAQQGDLRRIFDYVESAYKQSDLGSTPLATDQTHFYTMITSLIGLDPTSRTPALIVQLAKLGRMIAAPDKATLTKADREKFDNYLTLSKDRTTDTPRREERQLLFLELLNALNS
jgi:uncharacterized protein DUF262